MTETRHAASGNRLLRLLPEEDLLAIASHLEAIALPAKFVIAKGGAPITHAYFPTSGVASIVAQSPEGEQAEAGLFGREGWGPGAIALGSETTPHNTFMQVPGEGFRIERTRLLEAMTTYPTLEPLLLRFIETLTAQTGFTALSNAVHPLDERLARWLLMCHDRSDGDELALTHDFLALMLAVRRPSVTTSLHVLEGNRFIRAERGIITIRDRAALEDFARDAYGKPEQEYRQLIGPMR
jgi:CRP-like cAMP-binding protein